MKLLITFLPGVGLLPYLDLNGCNKSELGFDLVDQDVFLAAILESPEFQESFDFKHNLNAIAMIMPEVKILLRSSMWLKPKTSYRRRNQENGYFPNTKPTKIPRYKSNHLRRR